MIRRFISLFLAIAICLTSFGQLQAQALPSRVAVAIGGVIEKNFARLGFAANDPRIAKTLAFVGSAASNEVAAVSGSVGMAVAGVMGLPAWATIAIGLGVAALAFGAYKLYTTSSPSITIPGIDPAVALNQPVSSETGMAKNCLPGQTGCREFDAVFASDIPYIYRGRTGEALLYAVRNYGDFNAAILRDAAYLCGSPTCMSAFSYSKTPPVMTANYTMTGTPSGIGYSQAMASPSYIGTPVAPQTIPGTFDQIKAQLSPAALSTPIDPQSMADIANQALHRAAAQPGYDGIPVPLTQNISPQDVTDWSMTNPSKMPTPNDFVTPVSNPVVMPAPTAAVVTAPVVIPPATGASGPTAVTATDSFLPPGMDNAPTATQILAPILSLLPDFRAYVVPSHTASCPKPTVDVFNKHLVLDGHCILLEAPEVRQGLYAVMAAVWTIIAILIILGT